MRIVKCYIENFGGLNKFELKLDKGLNQIIEQNGFGKTTLAEFIKAMFYGFDNKTSANTPRKRYYPWNGGKYGGTLEFIIQDKAYRIERYFGKTQKGDTYTLYDVKTNTVSKDYSHNIGIELFGLDADSFIRSIYIKNTPIDSFNTDKIQAKLTNLVEDTNDINNFNKAMKTLKEKHDSIISNRRSTSDYKVACENITVLETEINSMQLLINEKEESEKAYKLCIETEQNNKERLKEIKSITSDVAKEQARKSVEAQITNIDTELDKLILKQSNIKNPFKYTPSDEELDKLVKAVTNKVRAEIILSNSELSDLESRITTTEEWFGDKHSIPSINDIDEVTEKAKRYNQLQEKIASLNVNEQTIRSYNKIKDKYDKCNGEIPSQDQLDFLEKLHQDKVTKTNEIIELHIDELTETIKHKENKLGGEVPPIVDIENNLSKLDKVDSLKNQNIELACKVVTTKESIEEIQTREDKTIKTILFITGIILLIASSIIGILVSKVSFLGAVLGLILAVISLIIKPKIIKTKYIKEVDTENEDSIQSRQQILANNNEIEQINLQVTRFINRYINDARGLREKLLELHNIAKEYYTLKRQLEDKIQIKQKLSLELSKTIETLDNELYKELNKYDKFSTNIELARKEIEEFYETQQLIDESTVKINELKPKAKELSDEVIKFITRYYDNADDLGDKLANIKIKIVEYTNNIETYNNIKNNYSEAIKHKNIAEEFIENIVDKSGLDNEYDVSTIDKVNILKDTMIELKQILNRITELETQKKEIIQHNKELLSITPSNNTKTLEELKIEEAELIDELSVLGQGKIAYENKIDKIRDAEDTIISKKDELEYWVKVREDCTYRSEIIDAIMRALNESRRSLSLSYLNKLQNSFNDYMKDILPVESGAKLSTSLDITVNRYGESKDKSSLSSGQLDSINTCMRMALIDSIFEAEKPFIIMDDPFVNLDDKAIERSKQTINKLADKYQILYMTCSDSRAMI